MTYQEYISNNIRIFNDTHRQNFETYADSTARAIEGSMTIGISDEAVLQERVPNQQVVFMNCGTATAARNDLVSQGKVCMLNFADALLPGGFVADGADAQEENLCKCTNLYEALVATKDYYDLNALMSKCSGHTSYEKARKHGIYLDLLIYTPGVTIYKDDRTFKEVSPREVDVITCPAPSAKLSPSEEYEIFTRRIRKILIAAQNNGVNTIVLGAWGCGAFGQHPDIVGKAFASVLNEANAFDTVVFAIIGDNNYNEFYESFYSVYKN